MMEISAIILSFFSFFGFIGCECLMSAKVNFQKHVFEKNLISIKQITAEEIPSSILSNYKWLDGYMWAQKNDKYYFIVKARSSGNHDADAWMKEIVFQKYKSSQNAGKPILVWEEKDFADFKKLEGIVYQKQKSLVKQASQNVLISMVYQKVRDGLDADTLKLTEWFNDKKLSVKGLIPKQEEDKNKIGKSVLADKTLKADTRLIQTAERKWLQYRKEYMLEY